ncbi:MAG: hypothetical protein AABX30_02010 [Nanoarchaeota archaeon]
MGNINYLENFTSFKDMPIPAAAMAFIAAFLIIAIIISIIGYVYLALVWSKIAKKLNYKKSWLAWIPIANISLVLILGGFHWALTFLILVPIFGWAALWILIIISSWKIFDKLHYPGALSLLLLGVFIPNIGGIIIIAYLVVLGFLAWTNKKVNVKLRVTSKKSKGKKKKR